MPPPVRFVIAKATTHISDSEQVIRGQLWEADHPIVLAHPDLFDTDVSSGVIMTPPKKPKKESG